MANKPAPEILQLTLFETPDSRRANYTALFDLAPRYANRSDRRDDLGRLNAIVRDFEFNGEMYRLNVTPARITAPDGSSRDILPGEREQLVEDVIRKFAAQKLHLGDQDEVLTPFSVYGICKELAAHRHTLSKAEVKEALMVLNMSVISITKLSKENERRPKAVVSAPAFPVLAFRDESDPDSTAYVQLNPLLALAIRSLAFERVNYDWMMQLRIPLARWLFKSISLMTAEGADLPETMELKASDIASSFGRERSRWRETLAEVEKAVIKLREIAMISGYARRDIKEGKKKIDAVFSIRFSDKFLADRNRAREEGSFISSEAVKRTGSAKPRKFQRISVEDAAAIKMAQRAIGENRGRLPH